MIGRLGSFGNLGWSYLFGAQAPAFQGLQLFIAGETISRYDNFAISAEDSLGERGTLALTIYEDVGLEQIEIGSRVRLLWNGQVKWVGFVESTSQGQMGASSTNEIQVECVSMVSLADRHVVSAIFPEGMTAGAIVAEILNVQSGDAGERLVDDGVQIDGDSVDTGPIMGELRFSRSTVHECMDKICDLLDYWWDIDHRGVLWFQSRASRGAPYPLEPAWGEYADLKISTETGDYRNVQILESGKVKTQALQVTVDVGNLEKRTFELPYSLASKPKIEVSRGGGAYVEVPPNDVGVQEKEAEKKWTYTVGGSSVTQASTETVLDGDDKVRVTYYGLFESVSIARNSNEIQRMKRVSGTSGAFVEVERDDGIQQQELAEEKVAALIARYGKVLPTGEFTTFTDGFAPGQILQVDIPEHRLVGDALITNVKWDIVSEEERVFAYKVSFTFGSFVGGWADYYRRLADHGRPLRFGENEKLNIIRAQLEAVTWGDNVATDTPLPVEGVDTVSCLSVGSPWIGWDREEVLDPVGVIIFPGADNRLIRVGPRVGPADYPEGGA